MTLKTIAAGVLRIAYQDHGPEDGWPCVLGHGFPYDVHAYAEVAPIRAAAGGRVVVPYLRGFGPTRFLSSETPRSGEQAALGADLIALMDALGIERAVLAGYDWGGGRPASSRRCGRSAWRRSSPAILTRSRTSPGRWSRRRPIRKRPSGISTCSTASAAGSG